MTTSTQGNAALLEAMLNLTKFLEGEGRPAEISHLIRDLRNGAEDQKTIGEWLTKAMESSWAVAAVLIEIDDLADMLGERHRIIATTGKPPP